MANNYQEASAIASDIHEHLPTLRDLASECESVIEMGVRGIVSTWGFVEGLKLGGSLLSIDKEDPSMYGAEATNVKNACNDKGVSFQFMLADTLKIEIPEVDLLFIDTKHTYDQLTQELELHSDKAKKYLVFHDTVSCEKELMPAIDELIKKGIWKLKKHYKNNNGLMILERC